MKVRLPTSRERSASLTLRPWSVYNTTDRAGRVALSAFIDQSSSERAKRMAATVGAQRAVASLTVLAMSALMQ
jgi:hypothetical protein